MTYLITLKYDPLYHWWTSFFPHKGQRMDQHWGNMAYHLLSSTVTICQRYPAHCKTVIPDQDLCAREDLSSLRTWDHYIYAPEKGWPPSSNWSPNVACDIVGILFLSTGGKKLTCF